MIKAVQYWFLEIYWWATVHGGHRVGHDWMTNTHTHTHTGIYWDFVAFYKGKFSKFSDFGLKNS